MTVEQYKRLALFVGETQTKNIQIMFCYHHHPMYAFELITQRYELKIHFGHI